MNDLPLVGLLLIAIAAYFIGYVESSRAADAVILLAGVTMGRGTQFLLKSGNSSEVRDISELQTPNSELRIFLVGLVGLLAFSAWWHLEVARNVYPGTRWTGLWDNPNIYGTLMGAGMMLTIGLLMASLKSHVQSPKLLLQLFDHRGRNDGRGFGIQLQSWRVAGDGYWLDLSGKSIRKIQMAICFISIFCRGSGDMVFLECHAGQCSVVYEANGFWQTVGRKHRVAAWKAGFEMMRDHPFGVGWNKAAGVYEKNYSPPDGGVAAITTNDYLMMGTQLGLLGLLCFVAYIYLKFKSKAADSLQVACRAGALVLLVAFWFDGGLFTLATASVFWILLELGTGPASVSFNSRRTIV